MGSATAKGSVLIGPCSEVLLLDGLHLLLWLTPGDRLTVAHCGSLLARTHREVKGYTLPQLAWLQQAATALESSHQWTLFCSQGQLQPGLAFRAC